MRLLLADARRHPLLTRNEEVAFGRRARKGSAAAVEALVNANLLLMIKIANEYRGCGLDSGQLMSAGLSGLYRAAQLYNPKRAKFSTYAALWIKQALRRARDNEVSQVRVPIGLRAVASRLRRLDEAGLGDDADTMAMLGIGERRLKDARKVTGLQLVSLDGRTGDNADGPMLENLFPDAGALGADEIICNSERERLLFAALSLLPDRQLHILALRHGLSGDKPRTLDSIGKIYRISRERARQILQEAVLGLRCIITRHGEETVFRLGNPEKAARRLAALSKGKKRPAAVRWNKRIAAQRVAESLRGSSRKKVLPPAREVTYQK